MGLPNSVVHPAQRVNEFQSEEEKGTLEARDVIRGATRGPNSKGADMQFKKLIEEQRNLKVFAERDSLRDRVSRLEAAFGKWHCPQCGDTGFIDGVGISCNACPLGEAAELRAALMPFAEWAKGWHQNWPDDLPLNETKTDDSPALGDCRRAAKLLAAAPHPIRAGGTGGNSEGI